MCDHDELTDESTGIDAVKLGGFVGSSRNPVGSYKKGGIV